MLGINVLREKKNVKGKEKYKGKENNIVDQSPKYDKENPKKLIEKGDTITLYIPNIVNEYPDMVNEGWTLSDVLAFKEEYKLNLNVTDTKGTTIPESEYDNFKSNVVIEQSRPVGDTIIEGITLKIKLNATYEEKTNEENTNNQTNQQNQTN